MHKKSLKMSKPIHKQRFKSNGSALIVALFVIVIVALLGGAMMKMQATSSENIAQEVLGTRALGAARTGMQVQLHKLFRLENMDGCPSAESTYSLSATQGLDQCSVTVTCERYAEFDGVNYYRLESTGECGSGEITTNSQNVVLSSRTIQVEARSL